MKSTTITINNEECKIQEKVAVLKIENRNLIYPLENKEEYKQVVQEIIKHIFQEGSITTGRLFFKFQRRIKNVDYQIIKKYLVERGFMVEVKLNDILSYIIPNFRKYEELIEDAQKEIIRQKKIENKPKKRIHKEINFINELLNIKEEKV